MDVAWFGTFSRVIQINKISCRTIYRNIPAAVEAVDEIRLHCKNLDTSRSTTENVSRHVA